MTDTNIVERLRREASVYELDDGSIDDLLNEAAEKIDRLERELETYQGGFMEVRAENSALRQRIEELEKILRERDEEWEKDVATMRSQLAEKDKRIEELTAAYREVTKTVHYPPGCGKHIITDDQIDKAWEHYEYYGPKYEDQPHVADAIIEVLEVFCPDIGACKDCGGSGRAEYPLEGNYGPCPACGGHGWMKEEVE